MKTKTIVQLLLLFIFINSAVYMATKINTQHKVNIVLNDNLKILQTHYNILFEVQKHIAFAIQKSIVRDTDLIEILEDSYNKNPIIQQKNRIKLYKQLTEQYETAKKQGILQMQFVFKDNVSFLRVHKLNKFGDDLTNVRADFKYTSTTHKKVRGFIQGRTAHGFRNVFPLFNTKDQYIGAMEISFSSENIQWYLNHVSNIHSHFLLNKHIFDAKTWSRDDIRVIYQQSAESLNYMLNLNNFHTIKKCIIENRVRLHPIREEIDKKMLIGKSFVTYVSYNSHIDIISFIPIKNLSNKTVAWIVSYAKNKIIEVTFLTQKIIRIVFFFISILILYFIIKQIYSNKEIEIQHNILTDIIDNTNNIMIITDLKDVKYSNNQFKELLNIKDVEKFNNRYNHQFLEIFIPLQGYISLNLLKENEDFISLIDRTEKKDRIVTILDQNNEAKAFQISIEKSHNIGDYIVSLVDVTNLKEYQMKTEYKAYIDGLTQVYNRNKFDELFAIEIKNAKRYAVPFSIAIIDIDKFKNFNDNFGHLIGDEVLITMAQTVNTSVRETDIFARWGGEEFIILLPETDKEKAFVLAENIRNEVGNFNFTKVGHITISIGITQLKDQEQQKSFIKRLDKAMYKAKQEGRNRSVAL